MNEREPMQKHTLNLFEGDYERLRRMHPETGAGAVLRRLLRRYLNENEPKPDLSKLKEPINV